MSQTLDMSLIFSSALSRRITFPGWQVNTSILKRLQEIEWDSSTYGFQKLQDIKWHSLIHKLKNHDTVEDDTYFPVGDACFPVYYRTYSKKGELGLKNFSLSGSFYGEVTSRTLFVSSTNFELEAFNFWKALPDTLSFLRDNKNKPNSKDSCKANGGNFLPYLSGNPYWRPDKLTKPICFVVDNANWVIRLALLSTPLVPALCMGSKKLRQAV
ncbi:MAG: hypothetical protein RLZZ597_506 [Cyanobacteriota bacterium]|jgi:hypothetical protein